MEYHRNSSFERVSKDEKEKNQASPTNRELGTAQTFQLCNFVKVSPGFARSRGNNPNYWINIIK